MDYSKMIPLLILTLGICQLFGTASCASLFGINFDDPKNVIRKGVERIPQIVDRIPFLKLNQPLVTPHPYRDGNNKFNENVNAFNPTFNEDPFASPEPNSIYETTTEKSQDNACSNQAPFKNEDSRVPDNTKENAGSVFSNTPDKYITEEMEAVTEFDYQFNSYYTATATTDDEWTTTDAPLNRIGAPPAVVASLLG